MKFRERDIYIFIYTGINSHSSGRGMGGKRRSEKQYAGGRSVSKEGGQDGRGRFSS